MPAFVVIRSALSSYTRTMEGYVTTTKILKEENDH
jgi:hypothetical protein